MFPTMGSQKGEVTAPCLLRLLSAQQTGSVDAMPDGRLVGRRRCEEVLGHMARTNMDARAIPEMKVCVLTMDGLREPRAKRLEKNRSGGCAGRIAPMHLP
jgi:hypothetical protein